MQRIKNNNKTIKTFGGQILNKSQENGPASRTPAGRLLFIKGSYLRDWDPVRKRGVAPWDFPLNVESKSGLFSTLHLKSLSWFLTLISLWPLSRIKDQNKLGRDENQITPESLFEQENAERRQTPRIPKQ